MVRTDSVLGARGTVMTGRAVPPSESLVSTGTQEVGLCIARGTVVITLVLEAARVSYQCEAYLERQGLALARGWGGGEVQIHVRSPGWSPVGVGATSWEQGSQPRARCPGVKDNCRLTHSLNLPPRLHGVLCLYCGVIACLKKLKIFNNYKCFTFYFQF